MGKQLTVVVGGTAGIGKEIARIRADAGDHVVVVGRPSGRGQSAADEIGAEFLGADLRSRPPIHLTQRRAT